MTTPSDIARSLKANREALAVANTRLSTEMDRLSEEMRQVRLAWSDTVAGLAVEHLALTGQVAALPVPAPSWVPRFPGDAKPGTVRWGQGGGNDSARALEHEAAAGVNLGSWRLFYSMTQVDAAVAKCAEAIKAGRVPYLSMKPGIPWADVVAGKLDAALRTLFTKLGALPGPVWFSLHHEPEGGGSAGNQPDDPGGAPVWRAMQARVRTVLDAAAVTNVAFGPCLMVWTWSANSGRRPDDWWVSGIWDFYGADLYQQAESGLAPTTQAMWLNYVAWCDAKGIPMVLGELGNRGSNAVAGEELRQTYTFLVDPKIDAVGAMYFDTALNSGASPYTLVGEPLKVFRELMKLPTSARS